MRENPYERRGLRRRGAGDEGMMAMGWAGPPRPIQSVIHIEDLDAMVRSAAEREVHRENLEGGRRLMEAEHEAGRRVWEEGHGAGELDGVRDCATAFRVNYSPRLRQARGAVEELLATGPREMDSATFANALMDQVRALYGLLWALEESPGLEFAWCEDEPPDPVTGVRSEP